MLLSILNFFTDHASGIFGTILAVLLSLLFYHFATKSSLLRDDVDAKKALDQKPYSLSRVQLAWWTWVVLMSFIMVMTNLNWDIDDETKVFSETALALIGIGIGTSAAGRAIDNSDKKSTVGSRHQEELSSGKAFMLSNVSSDQNGLSIHRLQQVLFSIAFGFVFLKESFDAIHMPEFDATWLAVLGVSAVGYAGGKVTENQAGKTDARSLVERFKRLLELPEPLLLHQFDGLGEPGEDLLKHVFESKALNESDTDLTIRVSTLSLESKKILKGEIEEES